MKWWHFLILGLGMMYLLFPTQNSTIDAWSYAAEIKHGGELFHPHHLLYNAFGFALSESLQMLVSSLEVLAMMKSLNALFATLCLFLLGLILEKLGHQEEKIFSWVLVVGSSFAIMRFATENEVYLLPILFSLLSSLFFLYYTENQKGFWIWLAGFAATLACLSHQIHFIWWIGIALGAFRSGQFRALGIYVAPALLVPLTYFWVMAFQFPDPFSVPTILEFVFRDFYQGTASSSLNLKGLLLTPVNFFRSFLQIHGIIGVLTARYVLVWIPVVLALWFFVRSLLKVREIRILPLKSSFKIFYQTHILIFTLQFLLAAWASGNAEFMVMLPFLLPFIAMNWLDIPNEIIRRIGLGILIWNFTFGIFPLWKWNYLGQEDVVSFVQGHPSAHYLFKERNIINNRLYYQTGFEWNDLFFSVDKVEPVFLDSLISLDIPVYTDAVDQPEILNRALLIEDKGDTIFTPYSLSPVDSISSFLGSYRIWQIKYH